MTSTCLLVLLLTSIAASERVDTYRTGGTDGDPPKPPDAATPAKNLPYASLCHPYELPLWDCDPTLNLICSVLGQDGKVQKEVGADEVGLCACGEENKGTEYHKDLLDFACPLKTLADTAEKRDAARTEDHGASCGYDKKDPDTDSKIKGCKEGLYCNFKRGKVCTCPKEKPIRDTVANACVEKTPDDDAFDCLPPPSVKDCAEHTHCDAATRKCVCDDGLGDWLPAPKSRCQEVKVAANGEACVKNEECDSRHCKDKKCAQEGAGTQIAVVSAALIIAAVLVALIH